MWKFVDSMSILHTQRKLVFTYSSEDRAWLLDQVSRYMVAEGVPAPASPADVREAIVKLEVECNLWAYGRHPDWELHTHRQRLGALPPRIAPIESRRFGCKSHVEAANKEPQHIDFKKQRAVF